MEALVIGGTRNLGPPLVSSLVDQGYRVTVFHRGQTQASLPGSVRQVYGDRSDEHQLSLRYFLASLALGVVSASRSSGDGTFRIPPTYHRHVHREFVRQLVQLGQGCGFKRRHDHVRARPLREREQLSPGARIAGHRLSIVGRHPQTQLIQPGFDLGHLVRRKVVVQVLRDFRADHLGADALHEG